MKPCDDSSIRLSGINCLVSDFLFLFVNISDELTKTHMSESHNGDQIITDSSLSDSIAFSLCKIALESASS